MAIVCDAFFRYAAGQAAGLQESGLSVTLYYVDRLDDFNGQESEREPYLQRARASGVQTVPLPRRRLVRLPWDTRSLHADMRHRRIGAAIVQDHIDPRYATLGLTIPVALLLHDPRPHTGDTQSTFPPLVRALARFAHMSAACLIVHSELLLSELPPLLQRLPVGITPHGAEIAAAPARIPTARRLLLFGRLYSYKGVDTALAAYAELSRDGTDIELVIAGDGPLAARARGLEKVELLSKYIPDEQVTALLDSARLVLLPYKDASQSGVGLQAVARGIPCIVSSAGALPELVEHAGVELVIPADDPKRLAAAISAHIDHGMELRQAVYDHASTSFSWLVVARRLREELLRIGVETHDAAPHPSNAYDSKLESSSGSPCPSPR